MKNQGKLRSWGSVALVSVLAAVACSDDGDGVLLPNTSGAGMGASAGTPPGGGGNSAGGSGAGGSSAGGKGGVPAVGGSSAAGSGGVPTAGSGGSAGTGLIPSDGGFGGEGGSEGGFGGEGGAGYAGDAGLGGEGGDSGVGPAPVVCDFTEVENGMNQATGLTAGQPRVLCGNLDNGQFANNTVDRDRFLLTVPGGPLIVRLDMPGIGALTRAELVVDGQTYWITTPHTVLTVNASTSSASITISGASTADVAQSLPYKLSVGSDNVDARCAAAAVANFTEAGDGATSVGNDVYDYLGELTPAADAAEATGITLGLGSKARADGVTANITAGRDGDSYAFRTAPGVSQVTLRSDWSGSRDMNLWLFKAGGDVEVVPLGSGKRPLQTSPEHLTAFVEENTDYVVFVRHISGSDNPPFNYALTMCGESYRVDGK